MAKGKTEKQRREMKQHFNIKNSRMAAASVPLEKLMCWKETGARRKKDRRKIGKEWQEGKKEKKKSTKQALGRFSKAKNVLKTTC